MRKKPRLWLRLPVHVVDARTLADHLRAWITDASHPAYDIIQTVADQVAACAPGDRACLRAVVAAADRAQATANPEAARYWESVAHAVERVADTLDPGGASERRLAALERTRRADYGAAADPPMKRDVVRVVPARSASEPYRRDVESAAELAALVALLADPQGAPAWSLGQTARRVAADVRAGRVPWLTREHLLALLGSPEPEVRAAFAALDFDYAEHPDAVIWATPGRHSGDPCFAGTRVPVATYLALREEVGIDEFLAGYPSVERWQLEAIERELHRLGLRRNAAEDES